MPLRNRLARRGVQGVMFEQSVIEVRRKPWSFAASLTLQSAAASTLIAVSIAYTESISIPVLHMPLPYVPPPVVKIVDAVRGASGPSRAALQQPRPFTAPARIPDGVAQIQDSEHAVYSTAPPGLQGLSSPDGGYVVPGPVTSTPPPPPPEPAPAAKPAKPVPIGGHVLEAMIVRRVLPVYPQLAKQARISGTVRLVGVIARDGTVQKLQVVSGHPMLVQSAVDAVKQWLYRPTLLNGEAVEVIAPIEVNFTLTR